MFLTYLLLNAGAIHFLPFSSPLINFLNHNSKFFLFLPKHFLTLLLFNFNSTKSLLFNFTPNKSYVQTYVPRYLTLLHLLFHELNLRDQNISSIFSIEKIPATCYKFEQILTHMALFSLKICFLTPPVCFEILTSHFS